MCGRRRGLDFRERRSIERTPVTERDVKLESRFIALEQHYLLLNALFVCHPVNLFIEVDESRALFTANSLLSQPQRFLYERHDTTVSVAAHG